MRRRFAICALLFILLYHTMHAQTHDIEPDSALLHCERYTLDYSTRIAGIHDPRSAESLRLLSVWEAHCDYSEPAQRLRVLLAIDAGIFTETEFHDYLTHGKDRYLSRAESAEQPDFQEFYKENKLWFCFLPLHNAYDQFTQEYAAVLLKGQEPYTYEYILCTLLSGDVRTYRKLRQRNEYRNSPFDPTPQKENSTWQRQVFDQPLALVVGAALESPISLISYNQLGSAATANFGFSIGGRAKRIELYLAGSGAFGQDSFYVRASGVRVRTSSTYQSTFGLRVGLLKSLSHDRWVAAYPGLGIRFLHTSAYDEDIFAQEGVKEFIAITTADLNGQVELGQEFRRSYALSIVAGASLRPFGLDRDLLSPLPMTAAWAGLRWYW